MAKAVGQGQVHAHSGGLMDLWQCKRALSLGCHPRLLSKPLLTDLDHSASFSVQVYSVTVVDKVDSKGADLITTNTLRF